MQGEKKSRRTILIVDDTPEDRATYKRYLDLDEEWQYVFIESATGARAIELCREMQPDCVLLDYNMPDMNGLEILDALKEGQRGLGEAHSCAVVMLTGLHNLDIAIEAMKRGSDDYLVKGRLSPEDLQMAVMKAIEKALLRRALDEQRHFFQVTLRSIGDGVIATDGESQVTFLNRAATDLTGWNEDEALGKPLAEVLRLLNEETREPIEMPVAKALAEGAVVTLPARTMLQAKDGREIGVDMSCAPIRNETGMILGGVLILQDNTTAKRAEMERELLLQKEMAARAEAQAANRAKDEFLALVSHELRSPLNAILGWLQLLRARPGPEMANKFVEIVERCARTQYQLIEDLLDSARVMTGKLQLDVRPVDPVPVIRAAIENIRPAAEAKSITINTSFLLDQEQITGDADRLQQVIWNLLANAVKFTPAGGEVNVKVERADPSIRISVSDTGKGIGPELLPRIFERFWQGEESGGKTRTSGLGLGLSLVKQIVELHGGTIEAESAGEGSGATFTAHMPLRAVIGETADGKRGGQIKQAPALPVSLAGARVLVVDDEEDARDAVSATLEMFGAQVRSASNSQEAICRLGDASWRPDLLVLDIGLPDESGYQLLERVRALPAEQVANIPAVALTAYGRLEDRVYALQAGFQMHVAKPVEPLELAITVASLLARRRQAVIAGD